MEYNHLEAALIKIGEAIKSQYKAKLKSGRAYATGRLYNSIDYRLDITDDGAKLVFEAENYYLNIEQGRKAGMKMPSIAIIRKWMIRKGIPDENNRAYLIARNIAKKGIKAKPYLKEIQSKVSKYNIEITNAVNLDIKEALNNTNNK